MDSLQDTESLTSGCFYFPAEQQETDDKLLLPSTFEGDTHELRRARTAAYQSQNEAFNSMIDGLISKANTAVFDDIESACRSSFTSDQASKVEEIATAVLMTGINIPDHDQVFALLARQLQEQMSPHVVVLRSYECRNISSMMKQLVQRLLGLQDDVNSLSDTAVSLRRLPNYDFDVLKGWYKHHYPNPVDAKPLVVLLQDFEAFDTPTLADFIISCSNHLKELPVYLIMGVASTPEAVHTRLPRAALTCLNIQRFKLRNSQRILTELTRHVLMSPKLQLHLHWRPLREILDAFFFHDLSVSNAVRAMRWTMLEHCSQIPTTALLDEDLSAKWQATKPLNKTEPPIIQSTVLASAKAWRTELQNGQDCYQCNCVAAVCFNRIAQDLPSTGAARVSQQLTNWLVTVLRKPIKESQAYQNLETCLKLASSELILSVLAACGDEIEAYVNELDQSFTAAKTKVDSVAKELHRIAETLRNPDTAMEPDREDDESNDHEDDTPAKSALTCRMMAIHQSPPPPSAVDLLNSTSKASSSGPKTLAGKRRQALRSLTRTAVDPNVERKKQALTELLEQLVQLCTPIDAMPLGETLFANGDVVNAMQGQARVALHSALGEAETLLAMDPQPGVKGKGKRKAKGKSSKPASKKAKAVEDTTYTVDTNSDGASEVDLSTLPDLSVAYHLHLEGGKYINLHDWLSAFAGIVTQPIADDDDDANDVSIEVQARFARAVSELQFLGLVKPTKRKQDHVARLTWGYV
eukprot:TRINITY_DN12029_c2_g1_i5.p1 TRINITY_DN12029_c2_g1~~TRINITY_DN12029_c2_g1_i5.p1  ORF type:complete len:752 (+),score=173.61 TRINITY_DN12029_c2_g1_i5:61-2316(+)